MTLFYSSPPIVFERSDDNDNDEEVEGPRKSINAISSDINQEHGPRLLLSSQRVGLGRSSSTAMERAGIKSLLIRNRGTNREKKIVCPG